MDLTLTIDIFAIFALVVSIVSLILSWHTSSRYSQLVVFCEFTRRFQEIALHLYSNPPSTEYYKLYFDLCCEEYYLNTKKQLPSDIWDSWVHEMKQIMKKEEIQTTWNNQKSAYNQQKDFKKFFEEIITQSITNKK